MSNISVLFCFNFDDFFFFFFFYRSWQLITVSENVRISWKKILKENQKTADCWHLSRRHSLTRFTRRIRLGRPLLKGLADFRVLLKKKGCKSNRDYHRLERIAGRCVEMGYSFCIPSVKPLLNQRQHQKCLWAMEEKNWTVAEWYKDEST